MWVTQALQIIPPLILVPYLLHSLGESGYGVYVLVWSLVMSIDQLQTSLQSGVVKYSAGFLAQGRIDQVNKVVSSSLVFSILLAIIACAGTLVLSLLYKDPSGQIKSALAIVAIMILFIIPLTPYLAVIQSRQRYYVGAIAGTISRYLSLAVVLIWFKWENPSVRALLIIMASLLFFSKLSQVPVAYRLVSGLRNDLSLSNRKDFRLIFTFGSSIVLASLCLVLNSTGVQWLMDTLASTTFVAHLAIMLTPGLLMSQILGAVTITVMPATSAYEATGNQRMLQEMLIRGTRYTMILVLAGFFAASLLMKNVLLLWVGSDYAFLAPYAVALFASNSLMQAGSISHHMLKGTGKLRVVVGIYFLGLVIVPVGLIFTVFQIWRDPYIAVTGGLIAGHLVCGILNNVFCARAVKTSLWNFFMRAYIHPLVVAGLICPIVLGILTICRIDGIIGLAFVAALAILLFFIGCFVLIATTEERNQVRKMIQFLKIKTSAILSSKLVS
jgi:O-antigen/teichoic acid export membrane protein